LTIKIKSENKRKVLSDLFVKYWEWKNENQVKNISTKDAEMFIKHLDQRKIDKF